MTRQLPLSKGGFALVDDDVYEWASRSTWRLGGGSRGQYVQRTTQIGHGGRTRKVVTRYLHREILSPPPGLQVDHINHDTRDNRRANLRLATVSQNGQNRLGAQVNSQTGVRGVTYHKQSGYYQGRIWINKKRIFVKCSKSLEEVKVAVEEARRRYYTHV